MSNKFPYFFLNNATVLKIFVKKALFETFHRKFKVTQNKAGIIIKNVVRS